MIPATWLNVGCVVKTVKVGEEILIETQGGFSKKAAPCSGFVVKDRNGSSMFVPDGNKESEK